MKAKYPKLTEILAKDPSAQPPKKWWAKMHREISEQNPTYTEDQVKNTIGDIWYHNLSDSKKAEIREREGKQYKAASMLEKVLSSAFTDWLDTFLEEKGIDLEETFTLQGKDWGDNHMSYAVVVEAIKGAPAHEQKGIRDMLVKIDFKNGDVKHYLRHLGQALAL